MSKFFTSRKFLLALAAVVYVLVQAAGGAIAPSQAVEAIGVIVLGYLGAEGVGDAAARLGAKNDPPATEQPQ